MGRKGNYKPYGKRTILDHPRHTRKGFYTYFVMPENAFLFFCTYGMKNTPENVLRAWDELQAEIEVAFSTLQTILQMADEAAVTEVNMNIHNKQYIQRTEILAELTVQGVEVVYGK